jgi:hypothetical protein
LDWRIFKRFATLLNHAAKSARIYRGFEYITKLILYLNLATSAKPLLEKIVL